MRHAAIVEVLLRHAFYADGRCADLAIEPSADTARLLGNHRCLARSSPDGIRVLTPLDPQGAAARPFLPLPADAVLLFHLRLRNPDFALFTDLAGLSGHEAPLFTSAGAAAGSAGELRLALSAVDRKRLPQGTFGGVEIRVSDLASGGAPPPATLHVAFQAKRARWAYYCVGDPAPSGGEFRIVDASPSGSSDVLLFGDANRTRLDEQPDPSDPIAAQIASRYPATRRDRFISDQAVACREEPRRYLELWRGDQRLAERLPNPSIRNASRDDLLFQIVKYRAQP